MKKKKVLLIEPNYSNKFPPIGLMKIATYYKNLGNWDVFFFKGDLKIFVIERIVEHLVSTLSKLDDTIDWHIYKDSLFEYIRTKKGSFLEKTPVMKSELSNLLLYYINEAKKQYANKSWEREWDRVGVTTLFTFYWKETVETINFAKDFLVKNPNNIMVGGVLASIQPQELADATGLKLHKSGTPGGIHVGILKPGDIDKNDTQPIDELELDYSILDEIEYRYPMSNAYYRYTTRGCVNRCKFCAVPILEPEYQDYIPLKKRLETIKEKYGEQKDLLLMDNNVLASQNYKRIIEEIKECGFEKGAKFYRPNYLEKSISNLISGVNDRAYIRKSWNLLHDFYDHLKGKESLDVFRVLEKYHLINFLTVKKENLVLAYEELKDLYKKHNPKGNGALRIVDFNQGMDARLFTEEKAKLLSEIAVKPVRIAFDNIKTEKKYCEAIRMCVRYGINYFSNYLLYNFDDKPEDLYKRLEINVKMCDSLSEEFNTSVSIYSFPMKYHPLRKDEKTGIDESHSRDYIGVYWNRKYIRAVQAILNSTKGKIGKGTSFFYEAFGSNIQEFNKLLLMPETMIIYRMLFKWLGTDDARRKAVVLLGNDSICDFSTSAWWQCYIECKQNLPKEIWSETESAILSNQFNVSTHSELAEKLLSFYEKGRDEVQTINSPLWIMKQEYDKKPYFK